MKNRSEWDMLASFLSDMIVKYADVIDINEISSSESSSNAHSSQDNNKNNLNKHIEISKNS